MATVQLNATGLRCPQPVLRVAAKLPEMQQGDILEVSGDCPTFEEDIRKWCDRMRKTLLAVNTDGTTKTATIQF
ncbi:MAG: sulfurtransferase TusA family protein [bacterium]